MTTALKTMSFNIRCDTFATQIGDDDYWPARKSIVTKMLHESQPHLLGVQELMYHQMDSVLCSLPNYYRHIGKARDNALTSEQCAIIYDSRIFHPVNHGTFWLSDTPLVKGSITWGNKDTRIVTWAHLFHKETHRVITVANTHFDHVSELSRQLSAKMLLQHFGSSETIIMGDFNASAETSISYSILSEQFNDALSIGTPTGPLYGTWNNYKEPQVNGERVDWILTSKDLNIDTVKVNTFTVDNKYPSDHLPIEAVLILE